MRPWASHWPFLGLSVPISLCKWGHRGQEKGKACPDVYTANQAEPSQNPGIPDPRLELFQSHLEMRKLRLREAEAINLPGAWLVANGLAKLRLRPRFPTGGHSGPPSHIWFQFLCQMPLSPSAPFPKPRAAGPPGTTPGHLSLLGEPPASRSHCTLPYFQLSHGPLRPRSHGARPPNSTSCLCCLLTMTPYELGAPRASISCSVQRG